LTQATYFYIVNRRHARALERDGGNPLSDFGLTWNHVLEAGGIAVGDEIEISLDLELVKQ